ncbi:unnamed protein product, partial [Closterium sp. NIES-53]
MHASDMLGERGGGKPEGAGVAACVVLTCDGGIQRRLVMWVTVVTAVTEEGGGEEAVEAMDTPAVTAGVMAGEAVTRAGVVTVEGEAMGEGVTDMEGEEEVDTGEVGMGEVDTQLGGMVVMVVAAVVAGVGGVEVVVIVVVVLLVVVAVLFPCNDLVKSYRSTMGRLQSIVLSLLATATLLLPLLSPSSAADYPLCPLTQKPPQKPAIIPSRCVNAVEASCCENCFDRGFALSAVLANETTILNEFAPSLAKMLGGTEIQLCSLFVGFHDCANELEQVNCALNCNPDSGNYVRKGEGVGANPIFTMCDGYATKMFNDCKGLPVPGTTATFGQFLNSKERLLNKTFGAIFPALGYISTTLEIVPGTTGCYNGPTMLPSRVICCDPLVPPANCPAGTVDNPRFKKLFNRTLDKSDCAAYAGVSVTAVVAEPVPSSSGSDGSASSSSGDNGSSSSDSSNNGKSGSSSGAGASGNSTSNGKGSGRFAGFDYAVWMFLFSSGMALSAVLANESAIVNQFAPSLAQLLGGTELQLCSLFVGFHDCSNDFEQVGCAINCNPDSANYVRQSEGVGTNPIFSMCDSFATKMFDDCKGLPVPGTAATFGQFLNSKERMLNKSFGAIFSALGYRSTSLEIVPGREDGGVWAKLTCVSAHVQGTTGCYNGPSKIPPRVICCDPLIPPANCPAGTVDNPQFAKLFNRTLDKKDCAAYASVPDVPVIVQPAPSSSPCPNGLASSNKGDDGSSSTGNCGSMSPSASSINGVSGGSSDNNGKGSGRFAGHPHQNTPAAARSVTCHRDRVFTLPLQSLRSSHLTRAASLPRLLVSRCILRRLKSQLGLCHFAEVLYFHETFPVAGCWSRVAASCNFCAWLLRFKKIPREFNAVNAADDVQAQFEKDEVVIMKIAVLGGTGNVGSKLAQRLCAAGHDVVLTSRNPGDEKTAKALAYVKEGGKGAATAAGVAEAVEGADAVIVATPGYATAEEWSKVGKA